MSKILKKLIKNDIKVDTYPIGEGRTFETFEYIAN